MMYIAKGLCSVARSYECLTNVARGSSHPSIVGSASVVIPSAAAWLDCTVYTPPHVPFWVI